MDRPKPEPLPFGLVEKNGSDARFNVSRVHPDTGVDNRQLNVGLLSQFVGQMKRVGFSGLDHEPSSIGHGVPCVQTQIEKRELELIAVDPNRRKVARKIDGNSNSRIQGVRHHLNHPVDHIRESEGLRFQVLTASERQHALRQDSAARRGLHRPPKPSG